MKHPPKREKKSKVKQPKNLLDKPKYKKLYDSLQFPIDLLDKIPPDKHSEYIDRKLFSMFKKKVRWSCGHCVRSAINGYGYISDEELKEDMKRLD